VQFHFDCVFYYVSDMERAITFYNGVLGMKLVSREVVARFDVDGVLFEIVPAPDTGKLREGGNARLTLKVDDIQQAVRELQSKGVPTSAVQEKPGGRLAFLEDPDGNEICLWQYR
jgi:catechol 2,3-dioxygenase-like lactoylglutathione lyase family enzyme